MVAGSNFELSLLFKISPMYRVVCTCVGDDNSLRFTKDFKCQKSGRCDPGNQLWLYRGKLHRISHTALLQSMSLLSDCLMSVSNLKL